MKYDNVIGDFHLIVHQDNTVLAVDGFDEHSVHNTQCVVQLESEEECQKLIKEFEDEEGELCWDDGSIMGKYEQLKFMRP